MKSILLEYWRSEKLLVNLGDYITEVIVQHLGYEVEVYEDLKDSPDLSRYDSCLFGVGSMLDSNWFGRIPLPKVIWGSGYWGDMTFGRDSLKGSLIKSARGPITRDYLMLDENIPLGDPGLILPRIRNFETFNDEVILYVPHFQSRDELRYGTLEVLGANSYLDIACVREEFWNRVKVIATAGFVLTSSLHGAIIAQAYGRPWALCLTRQTNHTMPGKWEDWFAYLGVEGKICTDLDEGRKWWEEQGCRGRVTDIDRVIEAFPHEMAVTL